MPLKLPFFTANDLKGPEDYVPYRNCISYIHQKSLEIPYSGMGQEKRLKLMEKVGMKNYSKFYRRRMEWDNLSGKVPLAYFEAIGVDMDVLSFCLGLDYENYLEVLSFERKVPFAGVRLACCIYGNIQTPEEFQNEKDAIKYYHSLMLDSNIQFTHLWIRFPNIIHHAFTRGVGYVRTIYYYPEFFTKNGFLWTR
jgi:hypothetical protein